MHLGGGMSISKVSHKMMVKFDNINHELKLIEAHFDDMICNKDRQELMDRYIYLLIQKQETAAAFKELKKWGSWKCVA